MGIAPTGVAEGQPLLDPPPAVNCGRVAAYTPPAGSRSGSVSLAWRAEPFVVQFGPANAAELVDHVACVHQRMTTSGPTLTVDEMPAPFCGRVSEFPLQNPFVGTGIVVAKDGLLEYHAVFALTPDTRLPSEVVRNFSGCFDTSVRADGFPTIVGVHGVSGAPPSKPTLMPNTSTDGWLPVAALAAALLGALLALALRLLRTARK